MRGNSEPSTQSSLAQIVQVPDHISNHDVVDNLRFGFGALLKNGEGDTDKNEHPEGKSLKGRFIVRVGWDDVRGWMGEVSPGLLHSSAADSSPWSGWDLDWYGSFKRVSHRGRKNGCRAQPDKRGY